jgi:hypothetical protein
MRLAPDAPSRRRAPWILLGLALLVVAALTWLARLESPELEEQASAVPSAIVEQAATDRELVLGAALATEVATEAEVAAPHVARTTRATSGKAKSATERWSGGVITGRVLGGPGASEPIPGIVVRATSPSSTFPVPPRTTRTDREGRYEFRDLVAARWVIDAWIVELDRSAFASVDIDEERVPTAELDVLLGYDRHVEVRLVDGRGRLITAEALGIDSVVLPLVGVGIARACKQPGDVFGPAETPLSRIADFSPFGERHTFDVVIKAAGGECLLALFGDRVITSRALPREATHMDLVLDAADVARVIGAVSIEVVSASAGTPVESGRVQFLLPGAAIQRNLEPGGRAHLAGVPLGTIDVVVKAPGFAAKTQRVRVPTEGEQRIELAPARRIAGRFAIEGERKPATLRPAVWLVRDPKARLGSVTSAPARRPSPEEFAFESLEPAVYVVAAVPSAVALVTADDVRAGLAAGAVWIDLTHAESADVRIEVPAWLELH